MSGLEGCRDDQASDRRLRIYPRTAAGSKAAGYGRKIRMNGLIADPARQAHDTLRGYIYQILRSIAVWLDLGDAEQLFLEGAEDLDRIGDDQALTEQVKDTVGSGNVTLRTASAIEAINNFWKHRTHNSEVAIRFRYLTTSGIGVEQGAPFGAGRGGLTVWNALREPEQIDDEQVRKIVAFLLREGGLSKPVSDFLGTATVEEVLDQLIRPIEWLAGQADGDALVCRIKDRLVTHGAATSIAPADAELAFGPLYAAAFDAAKSKDGIPLTKAGFLRIFAASTGIYVAKHELSALFRAALTPNTNVGVQTVVFSLEGSPPLPAQYFRRAGMEETIEASLRGGVTVLIGSTGSGKTLTAASTLAGRDPFWLTLRDLAPADVRARLMEATDQLRRAAVAQTLVIDDLDTLSDPRLIVTALHSLWRCQKDLDGRLLITADRALSARLAQALELDAAREHHMQPLNVTEIEAFLREAGCPESRAGTWSKLLELSTLGHPQLVSARVRTLSATEFPEPQASDLLGTGDDVDRIKLEARRLISELPEPARELLLRASLITGRLTRQRLIKIGQLAQPIAEPGAAVDVIEGSWLELTDDAAFRVSPLARGAAEQLRGTDWVKAMHGQLAWTYLRDRTVTPWDISSILMHCYIAGTAGPLVFVSQGMFSASEEAWVAVAEACEMYAALGLDVSNPLPFKHDLDVFVFRILQYRIAAELNPDIAIRVAQKVEEEFAAASDGDGRQFFRFLYLSQFLAILKVHYPTPVIVGRALEFFEVAKRLERSFPERLAQAGLEDEDGIPPGSYAQFAGLRLFSHIQDIHGLVALIDALRTRSVEDAKALLESIGTPDDMTSVLIERLWLAQHRAKDDQWPAFREKLRAAFDFSAEVGATSMARGIAPILLRLINEDIGDAAGALAEANVLNAIAGDHPIYACALAKVASDAGDFVRARDLWADALPRWPQAEDDIGRAFAYRTAAIAFGQNGEWLQSAIYFDEARKLVEDGLRPTFTIGLALDAALARLIGGECAKAAAAFGAVVAALEPMQTEYEREPLLSLQRRAGGVLLASIGWTEGKRTDADLGKLVGLCSNLDPFETDAPVAPPLDMLRLDLIRLQLACGSALDGALREAPKLRASPIMSLRSGSGPVLFVLAQRTLDFGDVVIDGLRHLDALAMHADQIANNDRDVMRIDDGKSRPWSPGTDELLVGNMVVATFTLAATNELDRLPLSRWRADAAVHTQAARVRQLVDHLEGLFVTGTIEAWTSVLTCHSGDWSHHATSSLAATLFERLAPDALLVTHGLWVHYLKRPHLQELAASHIEYLVTRQWRVRSKLPQLFENPAPPLTSLLNALEAKKSGWAKVQVILQAAVDIIPNVEHNARRTIEAM